MTYRTTVARNREGRWQGCSSPFTVAVRSYMIAIGVDPSLHLSKKGVTKDNPRDLTNFYSRVRFSQSIAILFITGAGTRERRFG